MTYVIRLAAPSDVDALKRIEARAAQLYKSVGYDYCAVGPVRSTQEHLGALSQGVNLVATLNDGAVAFALAVPVDGAAHLLEIATDPEHQRRGLAKRLISAFESWARASGFSQATLTTYRDVPWNQPFYERLGYEPFQPTETNEGLLRLIEAERDNGYHFAARSAMRKQL